MAFQSFNSFQKVYAATHGTDFTAAGPTAVWTPAAGKRFVIQSFDVSVSIDATCAAGGTDYSLLDGSTEIHGHTISASAITAGSKTAIFIDIHDIFPYRSTAKGNVLNVNLTGALTAGAGSVNVNGYEE